jgi:hypothetical protein
MLFSKRKVVSDPSRRDAGREKGRVCDTSDVLTIDENPRLEPSQALPVVVG